MEVLVKNMINRFLVWDFLYESENTFQLSVNNIRSLKKTSPNRNTLWNKNRKWNHHSFLWCRKKSYFIYFHPNTSTVIYQKNFHKTNTKQGPHSEHNPRTFLLIHGNRIHDKLCYFLMIISSISFSRNIIFEKIYSCYTASIEGCHLINDCYLRSIYWAFLLCSPTNLFFFE